MRAVCHRILAAGLLVSACTAAEAPTGADPDRSLQFERVEDHGVPVVRNLGGSAWGGNATLEPIREIGVEEGDERYMFARPWPYWLTDDEIFVLEPDDGRVRAYGYDGTHRRDIGRPGQGPGELEAPFRIAVTPTDQLVVAATPGAMLKLSFFTLDGDFVDSWTLTEGGSAGLLPSPETLLPLESSLLVSVTRRPESILEASLGTDRGFQRVEAGALIGEPWLVPPLPEPPPTYEIEFSGGQPVQRPVPWGIRQAAVGALATGEYLWSHRSEYRFHIVDPAGQTTTVERVTEPIAVQPGEAEFRRDRIVQNTRRRQPEFRWDGSNIPTTKPFIDRFEFALGDRIWVVREGIGERQDPCRDPGMVTVDGPCWVAERIFDVFATDGRYLGAVDIPQDLNVYGMFIRDDTVLLGHLDDQGVYRLRLNRLVVPTPDGA